MYLYMYFNFLTTLSQRPLIAIAQEVARFRDLCLQLLGITGSKKKEVMPRLRNLVF